jgi:predicted transcriptional regulator
MSDEEFLRSVHAELGHRKLDGFQYKTLARELGVSKQLLSQYLQGDIAMPEQIRDKIIETLELGRIVQRSQGAPDCRIGPSATD